jgi:GT2 family glycosyltransferase
MPDDVRSYELVVVSYRSRQPLSRLLDAVDGVPVVVVDNAANAHGVRDLTAGRPAVRYLDAGGNVGFAAAANLGASICTTDIVIFVNPDCIPTIRVLDELARFVSGRPDVASCSPALRDAAGHLSRQTGGWGPTIVRCLVHSTAGHLVVRRGGIWMTPHPGEVTELEWLAGTCLAVRRATFQSVGGFDEGYFLYNEDMALGDRFRGRGMRQILRADLVVEHAGGGSSTDSATGLWLLRAASLSRYVGEHNHPVTAFCMRAVLGAGSLLRAALVSVLPGHRHRRQEMIMYTLGALAPRRATAVAVTSLGGTHRAPAVQAGPEPSARS